MPRKGYTRRLKTRLGMNRTNVPLRQRGADLAAHLKTAVQSGPVRTLKEMSPEERAELERLYGKKPPEGR